MMKLNFAPSPPDPRDYKLSISSAPKALPSTIDLSSGDTSIKNQGNIGSCTAQSAVALFEYNYRKATKSLKNDVFSERFTYYTTRVNVAKWSTADSGAYVRDALRSLVVYGTCLEESCPYLINGVPDCVTPPSPQAYAEALGYQALTYVNIPIGSTLAKRNEALQNLKKLLNDGYPFIGGFTCYENLYSNTKGIIPLPKGKIIGGHAVCFVGYDDTKKLFKFKNSWGNTWGDKGYGYLPYQYLTDGKLDDLWTILTQEKGDELQVVKPTVIKADVDLCIQQGLKAIANGENVIIPTTFPSSVQTDLKAMFDRISQLKSSFKIVV